MRGARNFWKAGVTAALIGLLAAQSLAAKQNEEKVRIAVPTFIISGQVSGTQSASADEARIREAITAKFIEQFGNAMANVDIVERGQLKSVLDEQKLQDVGLTDSELSTAGKKVSARFILVGQISAMDVVPPSGAFDINPKIKVAIDARILDVNTGLVVTSRSAESMRDLKPQVLTAYQQGNYQAAMAGVLQGGIDASTDIAKRFAKAFAWLATSEAVAKWVNPKESTDVCIFRGSLQDVNLDDEWKIEAVTGKTGDFVSKTELGTVKVTDVQADSVRAVFQGGAKPDTKKYAKGLVATLVKRSDAPARKSIVLAIPVVTLPGQVSGAASNSYVAAQLRETVTNRLITSFSTTLDNVDVVERGQLKAILSEMKLQEIGMTEENAAALGTKVGAEYMVLGAVTFAEVAPTKELGKFSAYSLYLTVDVKLVSVATGAVLDTVSITKSREVGAQPPVSLSSHIASAARDAGVEAARKLRWVCAQDYTAQALNEKTSTDLILAFGSKQGAAKGMKFEVYGIADKFDIDDKDLAKDMKEFEARTYLGTVTVQEVQPGASRATFDAAPTAELKKFGKHKFRVIRKVEVN